MAETKTKKEESLEDNEEDLKIGVFDSTATSAAYLIGTTISGDPDLGKKFVKIVKKIEKRIKKE